MKKISLILIIAFALFSCNQKQNDAYKNKVHKKFELRKKLAKNRANQLFKIFDSPITQKEKEALEFLYAYMPLCDLADYNGTFFLKQVQTALKARETFKWGKIVPDKLFRHFVLPYRVNNENLDTARMVFFKELAPRIKDMNMEQAALEVNHWCHEKVNYTPSDIRTSGPLSTIRTSWGRCGEESTFTVTAMRAVGIPARQVYTPRWAHCDDNHAWVEVWVNGKWKYLGACEPEPALNMAWFTEPARRAMLVHTKVFGDYTGNYKVVKKTDNYTEINVIENYAKTKKIKVKVVDTANKPVENAQVDFGLYNYSEFYPIASKNTNSKGLTDLTTGYGALYIWASKNNKFAQQKVNFDATHSVTLVLDTKQNYHTNKMDFKVPVEKVPYKIDITKKKENNKRLQKEDKMRLAYRKTFINNEKSDIFANKFKLDKNLIWTLFEKSQGNWRELANLFNKINVNNKEAVLQIAQKIADKDLRDTQCSILMDHVNSTISNFDITNYNKDIYYHYILNPRIKNEKLIPYRSILHKQFKNLIKESRKESVRQLRNWINQNLIINSIDNYYSLPITPIGVLELKVTNKESRNVFFVAACRSIGIPARLEPTQKTPQYYDKGQWHTIRFEKVKTETQTGKLILSNTSNFDPTYYTHFTIAKLIKGKYQTLDYGWSVKLSELPKELSLEKGDYRIITGKRGADGNIFTYISTFKIEPNKSYKHLLKFRKLSKNNRVLGKVDITQQLVKSNNESLILKDLINKKRILLIWVEPGKEPTRHIMEEFNNVKSDYEKWDGTICLIQPEHVLDKNINKEFLKKMPENFVVLKDKNNEVLKNIKQILKLKTKIEFPFITVLNTYGAIKMYSQGYKIGIHEQIFEVLR